MNILAGVALANYCAMQHVDAKETIAITVMVPIRAMQFRRHTPHGSEKHAERSRTHEL